MANPEHINWLLEGVDAWNERRSAEPFDPDFEGKNLWKVFEDEGKLVQIDGFDHIPLDGIDLYRANLNGAILRSANLLGANLVDACLINADLTAANLRYAHLHCANLCKAIFKNAKLKHADLTDANLTEAKLINTELDGANLSLAELTGADICPVEHLTNHQHKVFLAGAEPWKANLYSDKERDVSPEQYQCELTLIITVGDLLEQIKQLQTHHDETSNEEIVLYFRGESKCGRPLQPGAMRPGNGLRDYESEMLTNLISRYSGEFRGLNSALEEWALAQHHGLPTRFLDVTRNPLVALFNACKNVDHYGESGRLHIFAVPRTLIKPFNSDTLSIIANFSKLKRFEQSLLLGKKMSNDEYIHYRRARLRLYQGIKQEKSYFEERIDIKDLYKVFVTEPQQFSERVRAQSGAFLVSAFHEDFDRDAVIAVNKKNPPPIYAHYKLIIPSACKGNIMRELELLNITDETLSPGLDKSAKAVEAIYKQRARNQRSTIQND